MTRVSVLIPVYNAEPYLAQTIQSVIDQHYQDWEIVILDDCSTDRSYEIALAFAQKDKRIRAVQNEQNLGMMLNWNRGIDLCRNEFFVKLDADDLWHPHILKEAVAIMDQMPAVGLIFTNLIQIDEQGDRIVGGDSQMPDFAANQSFSCVPLVKLGADRMLAFDMLRQGIALIRREIFDKLGIYLEIRSADTEMYFRIGCHYALFGMDQAYYYWRQHRQSDSSLIESEGKRPFYLYQVKNAIIDYYFQQGKITKQERKKSLASTQFLWNKDRIYRARMEKKYGLMLKILGETLWASPMKTLEFYVGRLRENISG